MSSEPEYLGRAVRMRLQYELGAGIRSVPLVDIPETSPNEQSNDPSAVVEKPPAKEPPSNVASSGECLNWDSLRTQALGCTNCALHKTRRNVVFGEGDANAGLVFIGEAPGADEDATGRPFVGRAGELLERIFGAMKLKREDVYICNILKCRPPGNRTPETSEVLACRDYLDKQLELLSPKVIVTLGAPASRTILNTTMGIMRLRGSWHEWNGIPVMPTFHPAYVLRQYTPDVRRKVWDDMRQVMEKLAGE